MSKPVDEVGRHIQDYRWAMGVIARPYDRDFGEEVFAALCGRDWLGKVPVVQRELAADDAEFARVLADCDAEWRRRIDEWAEACEFATSPWWRAIESRSRELRSAKAV